MLHNKIDFKKVLIAIMDNAADFDEWSLIMKAVGILMPLVDNLDRGKLKECTLKKEEGE